MGAYLKSARPCYVGDGLARPVVYYKFHGALLVINGLLIGYCGTGKPVPYCNALFKYAPQRYCYVNTADFNCYYLGHC